MYIAYTEDKEANDLYKKIGRKWEEIGSLTNVKDDGGADWFIDGKNTYIGSEDWKVSEDPYVASLLHEVQDLEDKLNTHLRGEEMSKNRKISFSFLIDKPVDQLQIGDQVRLRNGKAGKIIDSFKVHGRRVFVTDKFGRVFDHELEVK